MSEDLPDLPEGAEELVDYEVSQVERDNREQIAELVSNQMELEDIVTSLSELLVDAGVVNPDDLLSKIMTVRDRRKVERET